jgi:hypothetical protein
MTRGLVSPRPAILLFLKRHYYSAMPDLPIACTLQPAALAQRGDALLPGLARYATDVCWRTNGVRLTFGFDAQMLGRIADVIAAEHHCCRFLRFDVAVEPGDGPITLDVTGPDGTADFLERLLSA